MPSEEKTQPHTIRASEATWKLFVNLCEKNRYSNTVQFEILVQEAAKKAGIKLDKK